MENREKRTLKRKINNTIVELQDSIQGLSIQLQDSGNEYSFVENRGIFGLFSKDNHCCESWRFQPTIEQVCLAVFNDATHAY